ncbi:MAG: methyltransferase regulatory domain-containing protein, partial [Burkholderiales bacterium]|nr:methyltransferase regulatory domain-containing protein [Burkholderiales bacterium]
HEYLTPHGDPFYFPEVAGAMRQAGLVFAGSMSPQDNYVELMASEAFQGLLAGAPDREALEARRDFIVNASFRQDLYAAQPQAPRPQGIALERLDAFAFCLTALPERLPLRRAEEPLCFDFSADADTVGAVHALLARGPRRASDIHAAAGKRLPEETAVLIQRLVVAGHLAPCPPVSAGTEWMQINSAVIEAGIRERLQLVPLSCPLTGSASSSEVVHAAVIEAAARFDDAGTAAASVLARLRGHGHPVNRQAVSGERRAATDDEVLEYVVAMWRRLRDPAGTDGRLLRLYGLLP